MVFPFLQHQIATVKPLTNHMETALREWWHGHADGRAGSVFYGGKWVRNEESLNGTRSWIVPRSYRFSGCIFEILMSG